MMSDMPDAKPDFSGEALRASPFEPRQSFLNLRDDWMQWNGYRFARSYYDPKFEYFCVRNACATYDVSPMQKYEIAGADAQAFLNRLVTRDISKIAENRVVYTCWCTDSGHLIDDGTLFRTGPDIYMLVSGSPNLAWLTTAAHGFEHLSIRDVTDDIAALSFQGPTSAAVLRRMGLAIDTLRPFQIGHFDFDGKDRALMISRTGFTGDLGYELWVSKADAVTLWDALYAAGADYGIHPFGETATTMLRLEAGFVLPGREFNEALKTINPRHRHTPYDLGLGWLIDFNKPHFNGRRALREIAASARSYDLVKLDIDGNKVANKAILYSTEKCRKEIGFVTSAMWSPVLKANIALAMVRTEAVAGQIWAEINYDKELWPKRKIALCTVRTKPFWSHPRVRATPPLDF